MHTTWEVIWYLAARANHIKVRCPYEKGTARRGAARRGQMYYANLDPVIGSELGGNRPVLVIQNNAGNRHSPTIIIAPITTRVKKLRQPTHIGIPPYFGLPQSSMAMLEQIRTIDKSRLGKAGEIRGIRSNMIFFDLL